MQSEKGTNSLLRVVSVHQHLWGDIAINLAISNLRSYKKERLLLKALFALFYGVGTAI
jgi:hypothetical protein